MIKRVAHVAIAVKSLEEALPFYESLTTEPIHTEVNEREGVKVAFVQLGNLPIELLEPLNAESPIAKHIEKRGQGLHHVALEVDSLSNMEGKLRDAGTPPLYEEGKPGAHNCMINFLHPKHTSGVLMEFTEPMGEAH